MNRAFLLFAFIVVCASFPACSQVREFQSPPTLVPVGPQAITKVTALMLGRKPTPPGGCEQGTIEVSGRITKVTLQEMYTDSAIFNPDTNRMDPLHLRTYGGCNEGPLLTVSPGDQLRVKLINNLPTNDPSCLAPPPKGLTMPPGVGCFNTINMHLHGLHVSPAGNSDNVLLNISPSSQFEYEFNIPEDHPAGTFWYHAHRHGSTAVQVSSGSSGILVVRGDRPYTSPTSENPHPIADIDTILHTPDGAPYPEQFFFLQQLAYACFSNPPGQDGGPWQSIFTANGPFTFKSPPTDPPTGPPSPANSKWICPMPDNQNYASPGVIENFTLQLDSASIWDTNGRFTSINGIVQPTLTVSAGQIQRWRFVHAGVHDTINLQIVPAVAQTEKTNLLAESKFKGSRQEQEADVLQQCPATEQTLVPQFEIAADGLTLKRIHTLAGRSISGDDGANYLQPGYRSDILVAFPHEGWYCLLDQAASPGQRFQPGSGKGGGSGRSVPQLLGIIRVVGGQSVNGDLEQYIEEALYAANPQLPEPVRSGLKNGNIEPWAPLVESPPATPGPQQKALFAIKAAPPGPPLFQINGQSYDPNVVNFRRQVNTTDDWSLTSNGEPHIFHIHVNPFEVMDVLQALPDGGELSIFDADGRCKRDLPKDPQGLASQYCGMWHTFRDTVFVENNYRVLIRTTYDRYIGEFVIHCHVLDHEDAGMMLNIEIVPDLSAPGGGLGMAGMKHGP